MSSPRRSPRLSGDSPRRSPRLTGYKTNQEDDSPSEKRRKLPKNPRASTSQVESSTQQRTASPKKLSSSKLPRRAYSIGGARHHRLANDQETELVSVPSRRNVVSVHLSEKSLLTSQSLDHASPPLGRSLRKYLQVLAKILHLPV